MPTYDYFCPENERTVEAFHPMSRRLATWGELCACAEIDPGSTPPDSPVRKAVTTAMISTPGKSRGAQGAGGGCQRPTCSGCHGCG